MTIANAGHLSPYRDGREMELQPGLPLGVIADSSTSRPTFQLNRGDRLVFLSDGVVEATNAQASCSALSAPSRSATSRRATLHRPPALRPDRRHHRGFALHLSRAQPSPASEELAILPPDPPSAFTALLYWVSLKGMVFSVCGARISIFGLTHRLLTLRWAAKAALIFLRLLHG